MPLSRCLGPNYHRGHTQFLNLPLRCASVSIVVVKLLTVVVSYLETILQEPMVVLWYDRTPNSLALLNSQITVSTSPQLYGNPRPEQMLTTTFAGCCCIMLSQRRPSPDFSGNTSKKLSRPPVNLGISSSWQSANTTRPTPEPVIPTQASQCHTAVVPVTHQMILSRASPKRPRTSFLLSSPDFSKSLLIRHFQRGI